jgi:hypothetical protein
MFVTRILMVCAIAVTPSISFAAASGGDKEAKSDKDKSGSQIHLEELPPHRAPALDEILDAARERLEMKFERDRRRQRILKTETERKRKIEKQLENHMKVDLPDEVPASRKPGILTKNDAAMEAHRTPSKKSKKASRFIPITTKDLRSAFSKVGGGDLELHREGNDVVVDLLCNDVNNGTLVKALPVEKATDAHIDDARNRFCSD